MAKIMKPPSSGLGEGSFRIFLAGSIDNGSAVDWQKLVEEAFRGIDGVTLFNPRREDWDPSWSQDDENPELVAQIRWELQRLAAADLVLFYFDPKGPAPITLMELGKFGGDKAVVCCPKGYWRRANVQVFCQDNGIQTVGALDELIEYAKVASGKAFL